MRGPPFFELQAKIVPQKGRLGFTVVKSGNVFLIGRLVHHQDGRPSAAAGKVAAGDVLKSVSRLPLTPRMSEEVRVGRRPAWLAEHTHA